MDVLRLFGRKEKMDLCKAALAELGPLSTNELGVDVVRRKGMNPQDKVLVDAITHRLTRTRSAARAAGSRPKSTSARTPKAIR